MYKEKILNLWKRGNNISEICNSLGCTKSTVSYHLKMNGLSPQSNKLSDNQIELIQEFYIDNTLKDTCNEFGVSRTTVLKYCPNKRVKLTEEQLKESSKKAVVDRRVKMKNRCVEFMGGSCMICGYNKYQGALEFHHKDPKTKKATVSSLLNRKWETVLIELKKCIMVCSNCHSEIHGGLHKI